MDFELITIRHELGMPSKSTLTFASYKGIPHRFWRDLQSTDTLDIALEKIRETLQVLSDETGDLEYDQFVLQACGFGHLSMPNVMFQVNDDLQVTIHVESPESIADRRTENKRETDLLIGLVTLSSHVNPLQTIARSSITDVVRASELDCNQFVPLFDWLQAESTSLWFYFRTIAN